MYCPRCNIETGEDTFCENCGGATVASSEVAATAEVQANIPQPIQEEIKANKIKIDTPKLSFKKMASIVVALVVVIGVFIGYGTLKEQYTPKKTVEKYFNNLSKKDYDNAYKLLAGIDEQFLSKDIFKSSMDSINFKSYSIRNYNPSEYSLNNSKSNTLSNTGNMFTVETAGRLYPIEVIQDGKKFLFFNNYKINVDSFTTKWEITAPKGAKLLVSGKEPSISNEPNIDSGFMQNENYKPGSSTYVIDRVFNGPYDITATMEGAKDVKLSRVGAGKKVNIQFEPKEELTNQLQDQVKKFLELYYSKAQQDQYSNLMIPGSKAMTRANIFGMGVDTVTNKLEDVKITNKTIDDVDHAKITVKCTINYEDSSLVSLGGSKQTGKRDMTTDFYFERQNGKWLIAETGYIN